MTSFRLIVLLCLFSLVSSTVYGATDIHTVRLFVGSDDEPPTTPVITSVTPVAQTQIDIVWGASTDDVSLAGYRLFRDGLQIATTTLTSHSDTGLLASTTYSYTVDAFDSSDNFSSTSIAVATTTLPIVVSPPVSTTTPTTTSNTQSTSVLPKLDSLEIVPTETSAKFSWQTHMPTRYVLRWGRTSSYELGAISGGVYARSLSTTITQLEPGTKYLYELTAINGLGFSKVVSSGDFTTVAAISSEEPANVLWFTGTVKDESVSLRWQNPGFQTFSHVRVVRSHLFYPLTPYDGALVYQGNAQGVDDVLALSNRSPQYYTIFVYDTAGNVSSGAVLRADKKGIVPILEGGVGSSTVPIIMPDIGDDVVLRAGDVLIQQGTNITSFDTNVVLEAMEQYIVAIPYDAVPNHLKTIIVSISNPTNNRDITSYLVRLNTSGDRYEAVIEPPGIVGTAQMVIEVFDYNAATIRRISNVVTFVSQSPEIVSLSKWSVFNFKVVLWLVSGLSVIASLWWFVFGRRRYSEDN